MAKSLVNIDFKTVKWNGRKVVKRMERAEKRAFFRAGGFVQKTAKRSIRKTKKKVSEPGNPPKSHSGLPNLRSIMFDYIPREAKVIVGPIAFGSSKGTGTSATVPQVLEEGGPTTLRKVHRRTGQRTETRIRIRPRPYMGPAHKKVSKTVAKIFKDSL